VFNTSTNFNFFFHNIQLQFGLIKSLIKMVIPIILPPGAEDNDDEAPNVGLEAIQDNVVSDRTRHSYISEIFCFFYWLRQENPEVLTLEGMRIINGYEAASPNVNTIRGLFNRNKNSFEAALRGAMDVPLIHLDIITPEIYMMYAQQLRNQRSRAYLSKEAYGVKRSAFFHLFRYHNGNGYPSDAFRLRISNLFRGFNRLIAQRKTTKRKKVAEIAEQEGAVPEEVIKSTYFYFYFLKFFL
jgi:hypothetical protein